MSVPALRLAAFSLLITWMTVDNVIVFSHRGHGARSADRLSLLLLIGTTWTGISLGALVAFVLPGAPRPLVVPTQLAGFLVMMGGIALRFTAIAQLGRFHMPSVSIQEEHRVIATGLYRSVRHPSYLGAILAFFGFGLALGSWISAPTVAGITLLGYIYRMEVEERALLDALGEEYAAYRRHTYRLFPGLY